MAQTVTLNLNDLSAYKLFEFLRTLKGKGIPHARRLKRLHDALGVQPIFELLDENREAIELWQQAAREALTKGQPQPKQPKLHALKPEDAPKPRELESGDVDYLWQVTREWDKEDGVGAPVGEEYTTYLPIYEEVERARAEMRAAGAAAEGDNVRELRK
mgnify:CR=1 FL=1